MDLTVRPSCVAMTRSGPRSSTCASGSDLANSGRRGPLPRPRDGNWVASPGMTAALYRVYVDETGDRGWGGRASPIFVVSAVIVKDGRHNELLRGLDQINSDLKKP